MKSQAVSFRLDNKLQPIVEAWLDHHPGMTMSILANMAIHQFVTHDQVLQKVETVKASSKAVNASLEKMFKKHKKTLDELK